MEAKGCARPMTWKDARRKFYWATRARLAETTALAQLAEASPEMTNTQRRRLLATLAQLEEKADNSATADALEALDLRPTLAQLRSDHLARQLLDAGTDDRKAVLDAIVRLTESLSKDEKAFVLAGLQGANRSPGASMP
jgi:acetyl-CoA carboxylase/biotin carboxylase 1